MIPTPDEIKTGFTKNGSSFFTAPTETGDGTHGLLGSSSVDGVFATYCAGFGDCLDYGHIISTFPFRILPNFLPLPVASIRPKMVFMHTGRIVKTETMYKK